MMKFAEMISKSTKLTSLKLVKNKCTDEGAEQLIRGLAANQTLKSLNLTQNLLTERALDLFVQLFR